MTKLIDHLTTQTHIDPDNGKRTVTYYYKGTECPTVLISEHPAKKFVGYHLIGDDLADVEKWLRKVHEFLPEKNSLDKNSYFPADKDIADIAKALFMSCLTIYGKCFTSAKGRGIKLDRDFAPREFYGRHDEIMELRHTIAAHSGEGRWDAGQVKLVLPPEKGEDIDWYIVPEIERLEYMDDRHSAFPFLDLVILLKKKVKEKRDQIGNKIFADIVHASGRTEDYWYEEARK